MQAREHGRVQAEREREGVCAKVRWMRISLARGVRLLAAVSVMSVLMLSWEASLRRRDETRMRLAWQGVCV